MSKTTHSLAALTTAELAVRWKTTETALRMRRSRKQGPPYFKLGWLVRYRLAEIEKWERENQS